MQILNIHPIIDNTYNDPGFFILLESHLTYLRTKNNVTAVTITQHQGYKFEGDLYGLLNDLSIEKKYHYIVMRVNYYLSSADYLGDRDSLLIPDLNEVELLKQIYDSKKTT